MDIRHAVTAFFARHNFDTEGPAINTVIDALLYDMEEGLTREQNLPGSIGSAMDMIPTWLMPPDCPPENSSVIVIDAGGTNFRSCLVSFDEKSRASITLLERQRMPAIDRELSKAEFFDTIAAYLDHVKNAADSIAFCFSYAMKITRSGDGKLVQFGKEIKAPEVVGSLIGETLKAALIKRGWHTLRRIILVNDTTAALLAGAATAVGGKKYSSYIGFILGTGMNTAYIEYQPIRKIATPIVENQAAAGMQQSAQIVVCESGRSNQVPRSSFDTAFAATTEKPAIAWFEKMCSGAYLGKLMCTIIRAAAADSLFSASFTQALASCAELSLADIGAFLDSPYSVHTPLGALLADSTSGSTEDDRETLYRILDELVMRTARLSAANIAAAAIKTGKGKNPAAPICILAEGTTFLKMHHLRDAVTAHLYRVLTHERGIYFEIVTLDNAIILGTALAGVR